MKKVLFIYKVLPQYRVEFFEELKSTLSKCNIELHLVYGKSKIDDPLKKKEADIKWAQFIPNKSLKIFRTEFIWQPCLKQLIDTDLVIVQPENKLLLTYYLMFARHISNYKLGFWGHGRNMQDNSDSWANRFKYLFLKNCDWWFGYTKGVKDFLMDKSFPENKITVVHNAIDTLSLIKYYAETNEDELTDLKCQLGIIGDKTGIYCGSMYPLKRLDFILETCIRVKKEIPEFHMIFIGSGIETEKVKEASKIYDWIHYVGPKFGADRIKYFKISSFQLMPGGVGLGILDSFALEAPIITTYNPYHGPEISYLESGINGIISNNTIEDYVQTMVDLIKTSKYLHLKDGCRNSAKLYTIERMVENFKDGIQACINR